MTLENKFNLSFFGFIAVVVILMIVWQRACTSNKPEAIKPIEKIRWINASGDSVTSLKGTAEQFSQIRKKTIDSISRIYDVKVKHLQEILIAVTSSQTDVPADPDTKETDYVPPAKPDCPPAVKNMRQIFSNPYYAIRAQIGDSSFLHLQAFDTLTVVWKRVKEGTLFNRKRYLQVDVSTANPFTQISGLQAMRISEKKIKKWGIGLQAGYGWQRVLQPSPYLGIGISYNIIRL